MRSSVYARIARLEKTFPEPLKINVILPLDMCQTEEERQRTIDWENGGREEALKAGHRVIELAKPEPPSDR